MHLLLRKRHLTPAEVTHRYQLRGQRPARTITAPCQLLVRGLCRAQFTGPGCCSITQKPRLTNTAALVKGITGKIRVAGAHVFFKLRWSGASAKNKISAAERIVVVTDKIEFFRQRKVIGLGVVHRNKVVGDKLVLAHMGADNIATISS